MGIDKVYRPCEAMALAGITSAGTQEGKDFCTSSCPYGHCVVCEQAGEGNLLQMATQANRKKAQEMRFQGLSVDEIATHLARSHSTVWGYLAKTEL